MIQIGDKVRFLDAVGGGIVRSFSGKDLVMVEDEDGFEIPTLVSQCVVVSDEDDARARGTATHKKPEPNKPKQSKPAKPTFDHTDVEIPAFDEIKKETKVSDDIHAVKKLQDSKTSINLNPPVKRIVIEDKNLDILNVCLAFIPADARRITETPFYCYLVNDSNYWVFFTLLSPKDADSKQCECRYTGLIEPNTKLQLFSIDRAKADQLDRCTVQLLAFKRDKAFEPQSPMHIDIRLNTNRFYKLHSFVENEFFEQEALIQYVVRNGRPYLPMSLDAEEISKGIREKTRAMNTEKYAAQRKTSTIKARNGILEVDLHIGELLETTAGMNNGDMLRHQIDEFKKVMDTYRRAKGQKIVFIHGKGDGVLRKAILDELKRHYASCTSQDASFQQYGFGATLVTIG